MLEIVHCTFLWIFVPAPGFCLYKLYFGFGFQVIPFSLAHSLSQFYLIEA